MTNYHVPDMSCGHCKAAIETAMRGADAAARLDFDMASRTVSVDSALEPSAIRATLAAAGYPATAI